MSELREKLAELEHRQWVAWSEAVATNSEFEIPMGLIEKWRKSWIPYSYLSEEQKDKDRFWADKVLEVVPQKEGK